MPTLAGRAIVPFTGDYSALQSGAVDAASKIGHSFLSGPGAVATIIAGSIVAVGAAAVDMGAKYSRSTDLIASKADITIAKAQAIGAAFLTTGGQSTFSAQQIIDAYTPVSGQLGQVEGHALDAAEALGIMRVATDLAEASGEPLGVTTAALANVMQAYHLQVSQAAGASDILFNVSSKLNQPVEDVATVIDKLHGKLGAATPSLGNIASLMLSLAANGVPARQAVSDTSSAITTLLDPSDKAKKALADLGIQVLDKTGAFVGMDSIIAQLQPKLEGETQAQQLQTAALIFGKPAAEAMLAIILKGPGAFDAQTKAVQATGSAHAGAMKATDNLQGSFDRLKGKVLDAVIAFGVSLQPTMAHVFDWITSTGLPDLEKFGKWVGDNIIGPFVQIASVVVPPLLTALGAIVSWADSNKPLLLGIGATIAAWWAVDKISGWASAAGGAIQKVLGMMTGGVGGAGGSGAAALFNAGRPIPVYVTNPEAFGGIGRPGGPPAQIPIAGAPGAGAVGAGFLGLGGPIATATFAAIVAGQINTAFTLTQHGDKSGAVLPGGPFGMSLPGISSAVSVGGGAFGNLKDAIGKDGPQAEADLKGFFSDLSAMKGASGVTVADTKALETLISAGVIQSNDDLSKFVGHTGDAAKAQGLFALEAQSGALDFQNSTQAFGLLWQAGVTSTKSMTFALGALNQVQQQTGPLSAAQMRGFADAWAHGVTDVGLLRLAVQTSTLAVAGIPGAIGRLVGAIDNAANDAGKLGPAIADAIQRGASGSGGGGGYTGQHGGVAYAGSGQHWILHGIEAIMPKDRTPDWLWSMNMDVLAGRTPTAPAAGGAVPIAAGITSTGRGDVTIHTELHVHGLTADDVLPAVDRRINEWHGQVLTHLRARGR